jgi:hypothetical protein
MSDFFQYILPIAQQIIWSDLGQIPSEFVLYGGTAVALRCVALRFGHRTSVDFDFFSNTYPIDNILNDISKTKLFSKYSKSTAHRITSNHLDIMLYVDDSKIEFEPDKYVKLTFLSDKNLVPGCLQEPSIHSDNNLKIASPIDLFSHKIWAAAQLGCRTTQ